MSKSLNMTSSLRIIMLLLVTTCTVLLLESNHWSFAQIFPNTIHLFLSPNGSDTNSGNSTSPFLTFNKVVTTLNSMKNSGRYTSNTTFIVNFYPGTYYVNSTTTISKSNLLNDENSPVIWKPVNGSKLGDVKIRGGVPLPAKLWHVVTASNNPSAFNMLPEKAKGNVLQCNLTQAGFKSSQLAPFRTSGFAYGSVASGNELFFKEFPQTVARYPNKLTTMPVADPGIVVDQYLKVGKTNGTNWMNFNASLAVNRPKWPLEKYPFAFGFYYYDWADANEPLSDITSEGSITFKTSSVMYGIKTGQPFFLVNFLSELDQAGEYVIHDEMVYYWPPAPIQQDTDVHISVASALFSIAANAQVFDSLDFGIARGGAIGSANQLRNVTIRNCNFNGFGGGAVSLQGYNNTVLNNTISNTGQGGISVSGGDRMTLTPSNTLVMNNTVSAFTRIGKTYRGAVYMSGVGITITHNEFFDSDHLAIQWGGNNNEISYNKIHDVCKATGDAGAIYSGRDWTQRGNIIKHNLIYNVKGLGTHGGSCLYLDDNFSSAFIFGNIFYNCYRGFLLGGGRNNHVFNNLFINNTISIHIDDRGLNWIHQTEIPKTLMDNLLKTPFNTSSVWINSYPELVTILQDTPFAPYRNLVQFNLISASTKTAISQPAVSTYSTYANNTFDVPYSVFGNPSQLNFTMIAGNEYETNFGKYNFTKIPVEEIGLLKYEKSDSTRPVVEPSKKPSSSMIRPSPSSKSNGVSGKPRASISIAALSMKLEWILFLLIATFHVFSLNN
ncbi:hypothetical protein C9374_013773 [Naegleria lovaniensis]|uniref:Right handed beta helix domain-containing protein n=1 Tax=Naegleria lovaniensis TaxID=51637 RepID=A0AA88G963_NAELO|nr:uncharacterized protein C9374_013773 [Naegleria lovaniensis]KAG2370862.1 hypothetical protein C9374_013773 [Naegleria lovaniensis]